MPPLTINCARYTLCTAATGRLVVMIRKIEVDWGGEMLNGELRLVGATKPVQPSTHNESRDVSMIHDARTGRKSTVGARLTDRGTKILVLSFDKMLIVKCIATLAAFGER